MVPRIRLPLITGFTISGFTPLYSQDIHFDMGMGPYVILGGNGLGKTTLIQAVVFGLGGAVDLEIEDQKPLRWNHSYFKGRLPNDTIAASEIEVRFRLGSVNICVKRGLRFSGVKGVRIDGGEWNEANPDEAFSRALREAGGYQNVSDFAFVVHRLLYLPETRRHLAWDTDAQIRLLMLLNQDVASDAQFREQRATLKNLDSQKRHIHVALGKADTDLANLLAYEETVDNEEEEDIETVIRLKSEKSLPLLVQELSDISRIRFEAERRRNQAFDDLSMVSARIDSIRAQVENAESKLIAGILKQTEKDHGLALSKLVSHGICPACGQHHTDLAQRAKNYLREHRCTICGLEDSNEGPDVGIKDVRICLEELLRQQQAFEQIIRLAEAEWQCARNKEVEVQTRVNDLRYQTSMVSYLERELPDKTVDGLRALKQKLEMQEADAEIQLKELREKLEADYARFRKKTYPRRERLRESYSAYAREFLGLPCELEEVDQQGMLNLKLYVPAFNGKPRTSPQACSEAQRFFLDIAFRMALIDTVCEDDNAATFLCETPETALDFSYIDNVVKMFTKFSSKTRNILLTANLQKEGIAQEIVMRIPKKNRKSHVVNLLEFGLLSEVQESSIQQFNDIVKKMLTASPNEIA